MREDSRALLSTIDAARGRGQRRGHYESHFLRANHPSRPLAFWIRHTLFIPRARPAAAVGELWAVVFDGESGRHVALKQTFPISECEFDAASLRVAIGESRLEAHGLRGAARSEQHSIAWNLSLEGDGAPLLLLPRRLYETRLPAAKSFVGLPLARFRGSLTIDGTQVAIDDWRGSRNHNWGTRHTDRYAWGQVAGFDNSSDSFLELATARLRIGPLWTPAFTPIVLRHRGAEYRLNGLARALRARGEFDYFCWRFSSTTSRVEIEGEIEAPREAFVALEYLNPPGGSKQCLNTKIATCRVRLRDRERGLDEILATKHRAAFEILTDDREHGVPISV
jgi:hypothetical protein